MYYFSFSTEHYGKTVLVRAKMIITYLCIYLDFLSKLKYESYIMIWINIIQKNGHVMDFLYKSTCLCAVCHYLSSIFHEKSCAKSKKKLMYIVLRWFKKQNNYKHVFNIFVWKITSKPKHGVGFTLFSIQVLKRIGIKWFVHKVQVYVNCYKNLNLI